MKISFVMGDWGRNIGNAFFQLGGHHVLKKVKPEAKIAFTAEQPGYPSYWNPRGGNPEGYFPMADVMDTDYLVLMGPLFRGETESIWAESFKVLQEQGTQIILLGAAAMTYNPTDVRKYRDLLERFPPYLLISRDSETYQLLGDLAEFAYDGFDLGFYLPEIYQPVGFREHCPMIALNFDKIPHPEIQIGGEWKPKDTDRFIKAFQYQGQDWLVKLPRLRTKLAENSRYLMFLEGVIFPGKKETEIGGYQVVRTDHRPHPMIPWKTYRDKNVLVNDVPYPYLEVYSQAELTLSNRIHACVASLSYGQSAMLFSRSPRIRMLDRMRLPQITEQPARLDLDWLEAEKDGLENFLREHL
jgi:hypothetical protein